MDLIDQILGGNRGKKYTNSQRLAYIEPAKTLTFDGNSEDKETWDVMVKISEQFIDLSNAVSITMVVGGTEIQSTDIIAYADDGTVSLFSTKTEQMLAASIHPDSDIGLDMGHSGTFVVCEDMAYVSRIEFAETIHPIDPKYLPGVCLPVVVDLAKYEALNTGILYTLATNGGVVQDIEVGTFWEEVNTDSPLKISIPADAIGLIGVVVESNLNSVTTMSGALSGVEFNLLILMNRIPARITVLISKTGETTAMAVVAVEPLTIPGVE